MRSYVVDASVASRFLLKEDLADEAERVLRCFTEGEVDLASPQLVVYEVGNALRTAASRGIIKSVDAGSSFEVFLGLRLGRMILSDDDYSEALKWSMGKGVSYYDGIYVQASRVSGYALLTADNRQLEAAKGAVEVVHLKEFS